ncbi:hypothetical protein BWI17_07035 [Betaproteobacteria bacterium GR16-43]|nr:hypothetical protein BWI17_07035 [Betaproteobacteria bacterium GR16-43]
MDIDVFSPRELGTVFNALRTSLNPGGPLALDEKVFLETYAGITGYALPPGGPMPIAARDVAIEGAHARKRLIQLCAIAAMLARPVRPASVAFVQELARHLGERDTVTDVLEALVKGRHLSIRMIAMRRALRAMTKEAYRSEGAMGVVRLLGAMFLKASVNRDKLWNYKRLGLLPEGTLGREYWKHLTQNGFGAPGEPGGIPESVAYHDVGHVLAGYDTTPQGEIQQGSFQAGNRREDGFFFLQFVILQFHQGVKVSPATGAQTGCFDPRAVLWALHRGAQCNVDITHQWDFWPLMALPLEEARARCGLLGRLPMALAA